MDLTTRTTEYLRFTETASPSRKTRTWTVYGLHNERHLGNIGFYGRWRQFVFYPEVGTLFNKGCLSDINTFMEDAYRDWRESKAVQSAHGDMRSESPGGGL